MSFLPISTLVPEDLRASVRTQIAAFPNPVVAKSADEVADLIFLAVTEAVSAIDRVASSASNTGIGMAVLSGAGATTQAVLRRLEDSLMAYAKAEGGQIYNAKVTIAGARS